MTTTVERDRARASARRTWWPDGLEAAIWVSAAIGVALMLRSGGLQISAPVDLVYTLGRALGIVAAVLMLAQVLLVSRAPYIEQSVGHDRTTALHTRLGTWAIVLMLTHASIITGMSAYYDGRGLLDQAVTTFTSAWDLAAAQIALTAFFAVLATSIAIVRRRLRYESWHVVHLLVYVGIAGAVPHQFLEGSTFRDGGAAWWFWFALYTFAFGSLLVFRFAVPLWRLARHDPRVSEVTPLPDGSVSITVTGRDLDALGAKPGQFMLWRFLDGTRWREAHPFSLSAKPTSSSLRLTVRPSGDFTRELASLAPGTRVAAEGPLGIFTHSARQGHGLVLVAAGIGITPIRAMLEECDDSEPCTVIVRASGTADSPLLDEVEELVERAGASLHVLHGPRGDGWTPRDVPGGLADLVEDVDRRDVYICGPLAWADAVEADARACGVPATAVHRERFAW